MVKPVWPTAIRARFLPRRAAMRLYCAARYVFLVFEATWAISTRICRSQRLPLRVFPLRRFPPLSWFPGHIPAHEARCLALGNRLISVPISAMRICCTLVLLRPSYAGARLPPLFQTIAKAESPLSFLETKRPTGAYKRYSRNHSKTGCDDKRRIVEIKRPDTVGEPLLWFLIVQKKVLKGDDEGEYVVVGGYEGSSCLWLETDEGFCYQVTTKNIFVVKACLESTPCMAVLLGSRLWYNAASYGCSVSPNHQKEVRDVAPPSRPGACAGRNRPCGSCRLSQRQSLPAPAGYPWHHL